MPRHRGQPYRTLHPLLTGTPTMDEYDARLLDQHLEYYFADAEDEQEGLEEGCSLGLYVGEDD